MNKMRLLSQAELRKAIETEQRVFYSREGRLIPGCVVSISDVSLRPWFIGEDPGEFVGYVPQMSILIKEEIPEEDVLKRIDISPDCGCPVVYVHA